jgi:hypothetical protein
MISLKSYPSFFIMMKKILIVITLLFPFIAFASVSYVASTGANSGGATGTSFSTTVHPSTPYTFSMIEISFSADISSLSCTIGGVTATQLGSVLTNGGTEWMYVMYASGSFFDPTVYACSWTTPAKWTWNGGGFSGVGTVGTSATGSGNGSSWSNSVTLTPNDLLAGFSSFNDIFTNLSVTTGIERRSDSDSAVIGGNFMTNSGTGSVSAAWSLSGGAKDFSYQVVPLFAAASETLKAVKPSNQSVSNSSTLQNDNNLTLTLAPNTTYIVDGTIFAAATTTNSGPDIILGFSGQSGTTGIMGYSNDKFDGAVNVGGTSSRITLPRNDIRAIRVTGTITTGGTPGNFHFQWAQATSSNAPTTVLKGSYLRAEAI